MPPPPAVWLQAHSRGLQAARLGHTSSARLHGLPVHVAVLPPANVQRGAPARHQCDGVCVLPTGGRGSSIDQLAFLASRGEGAALISLGEGIWGGGGSIDQLGGGHLGDVGYSSYSLVKPSTGVGTPIWCTVGLHNFIVACCPHTPPLYSISAPAQVLNGMGVTGHVEGTPAFKPTDAGGEHLHFDYRFSEVIFGRF